MKQQYRHTKPIRGKDPNSRAALMPFGDEPTQPCHEEDGVKCYSCGGYFPESSCVANTLDEGESVPVCEICAEGRVG
tara:strand:+ start:430 stop:660 length:231 start_codon:yes stop_codon:yes gene_type:complete